ncbi:HIT family protein [Streptomyces cavernicola]|uniref:HIT family protein n=1 Tax=Streptomyces cavernicola TaxID=3043613 RepID=A0ABT6S520_9ACTN|nr:HIT family protein [Streptomyces sp. B-S-A6]MDI3403182.1 HIT family protein [Streptomyces sp. B-S-A6]
MVHRHIAGPLVHRAPAISETCVFCHIVAGTEPATVVRDWDDAFGIKPRGGVNSGHTLVIPRRHVDNAVVDPAITALTMARAAELGAELACDLNVITSVGTLATQTVSSTCTWPRVRRRRAATPLAGLRQICPQLVRDAFGAG